jgi:hypothetical protein
VFPQLGKARAQELAESCAAGVKAAGAAAVAGSLSDSPLAGAFAVLAVLLQLAEARCRRIAEDPPRGDFRSRTVARRPEVQPAPAEDPYGVINLGMAVRDLTADLNAVVTAFERQLGALEREEFHFADMRRAEAVRFGLAAADVLHYVADSFPTIPLPPRIDETRIWQAEDLSTEVQAYLFRSAVSPSPMNGVLAVLVEGDGHARERVDFLPRDARRLAQFFEEWDGQPVSS